MSNMISDRYTRQTALKGFGPGSQEKLQAARVLIVGLGGLGIPAAQYLNAMGVGELGLVEQDRIDRSNLHRQVLYTEDQVGKSKLEASLDFLRTQNPATRLNGHDTFLTRENALELLQGYDVIVDGTDNFPTRYLINDACVILKKPFIYGALHGFEGQVSVFGYRGGPTYRCLFPNQPTREEIPDCNRHGVLGVLPGIIGSLQALETVKVLAGLEGVLSGTLLMYDGLQQSMRRITFPLNASNLRINRLAPRYEDTHCATATETEMESFLELWKNTQSLQLIDVREVSEFNTWHLPGSVNCPLSNPKSFRENIDPSKAVYLICAMGSRSKTAQHWLQQNWPELEVHSLKGGMERYHTLSVGHD